MLSPELVPIAAAALIAFCALGVVVALFYAQIARRSESHKRFTAIASRNDSSGSHLNADESRRKQSIEATLRELEEKQKNRKGAKPSLTNRMRQGGLNWSKKTYYIACLISGLISFFVALTLVRVSLLPALGFGLSGGLLLPHLYVGVKRNSRFKKFSDEFPNAVDIIVRGIKAGLPLVDCMRIISMEAQEPVRSEFKAIIEDQTMGMPMDQAVQRLPDRVPLTEANFFAIVIALQSRTGGSLSEALGNLSRVLRERKKMKAKIKAVSSEAKSSAAIIGSLPVVVSGLIYVTSPEYIALLFSTPTGHFVLVGCALWMGMGIMVMRKMINFDF